MSDPFSIARRRKVYTDPTYFTLLDECFRVEGRKTWYIEIEEIQRDLDRFLAHYNLERSHQGYRLNGRTPAQALREALGREELPPLDFTNPQPEEESANTTEITA